MSEENTVSPTGDNVRKELKVTNVDERIINQHIENFTQTNGETELKLNSAIAAFKDISREENTGDSTSSGTSSSGGTIKPGDATEVVEVTNISLLQVALSSMNIPAKTGKPKNMTKRGVGAQNEAKKDQGAEKVD